MQKEEENEPHRRLLLVYTVRFLLEARCESQSSRPRLIPARQTRLTSSAMAPALHLDFFKQVNFLLMAKKKRETLKPGQIKPVSGAAPLSSKSPRNLEIHYLACTHPLQLGRVGLPGETDCDPWTHLPSHMLDL